MGRNKAPKNGFYYFFTELKGKQKQPISNDRAVELASPLWNKMTAEQRKPYEDKAKIAKKNRPRETCTGESVDVVVQEEKRKIEKAVKVHREIENLLKLANSEGMLADIDFNVIHMNYFFHHQLQDRYYPAEVALGKFNLRDGILIRGIYHSNIYPGKFPMGYKLTAQQKAEETHKLQTDFGNKNNMREVLEMLIHHNKDDTPFFVLEKDLYTVNKMIQDMCAECEIENVFNIYPLDYLFYVLKNMVHGPEKKTWPVTTLGTITLEKDTYDMCEEIACDYHQVIERQAFCSKSKIIRWAYTICDNCSYVLNIKFIPGQHVPINADIENATLNNVTSSLSTLQLSKNKGTSRGELSKIHKNATVSAPTKSTNITFDSDVGSYHGFESTDSQAVDEDEEEWTKPKRSVRLRENRSVLDDNYSGASSQSQQSQSQSLDLSQLTLRNTFLEGRRPETMSQVFRGRGRGRLYKRPE